MTASFFSIDNILIKNTEKEFFLTQAETNTIDSIWRAECKKRALFDGAILCFQELNKNVLVTFTCSYKYLIASQKNASLRKKLLLKPIGITALTIFGKELIVAKRSSSVSTYRNFIETVPSGSLIPSKSVTKQLLDELCEETGIEKRFTRSTTRLGLFYSPRSRIYDLGYLITLSKKLPLKRSDEHTSIEWISFDSWKSLLNAKRVTPVSRILWSVYTGLSDEP